MNEGGAGIGAEVSILRFRTVNVHCMVDLTVTIIAVTNEMERESRRFISGNTQLI